MHFSQLFSQSIFYTMFWILGFRLKFMILFMTIFFVINMHSQQSLAFQIDFGSSAAIGNYGCIDCNNGAFAKSGEMVSLSASYPIYKKWRLCASLKYQRNGFDQNGLTSYLSAQNPDYTWSAVESQNYNSFGTYLGFSTDFEILEDVYLEPRFQLGLLSFHSPYYKAEGKHSQWRTEQIQVSGIRNFWVPSFLVGTHLKYSVHKQLAIAGFFELLTSSDQFEGIYTYGSQRGSEWTTYTHRMTTFNFGVGLIYSFQKTKP